MARPLAPGSIVDTHTHTHFSDGVGTFDQNAAAALYAAEDPEAALREMGFREDGGWTLEGDGWTLAVALGEEAAPAGALRTARIAASAGGEALFELPLAKYVAEEAAR